MSFPVNAIGSFQFENLIRNRVPFVLLNLGTDLKNLFPPFHQSHLERQIKDSTPETALPTLREAGVPAEQAILLICEDGSSCERVASSLEDAGYGNVYWILGGSKALRQELQGGT